MNQDPRAPTIDVIKGGFLIPGFQIDPESSVNLLNVETMNKLRITNVVLTTIILKMANSSRGKPLDVLEQVPTLIMLENSHITSIEHEHQMTKMLFTTPISTLRWLNLNPQG